MRILSIAGAASIMLAIACSEEDASHIDQAAGGAPATTTTSGGSGGSGAAQGGSGADGGSGGGSGGEGRDYSSDRGKFFGDSRCGAADVLLCDGFEAAAIDSARWNANGAAPTVDGVHAARGAQALHVHTQDNGLSFLRHSGIFPVTDDTYWGRMFVWIDALPTNPDWAHWTLVGADGPDIAGEIRVGGQFNPQSDKNLFGVGTDGGATGDWTNLDQDGGAVPVPTQDWVCIEWLHQGSTHETRFFWDATEHASLYTSATDHGGNQGEEYLLPTFDSVWVGWWLYQPNPTPDHYDVWIDEVAFDSIRIGCVL